MQQHVSLSSYHFRRSKFEGIIEVLNETSYIMAEYNERTGAVKWQRVVAATQRQQIENWLGVHYPIQTQLQVEAKRQVAAAHSVPAPAAKPAARRTRTAAAPPPAAKPRQKRAAARG